MQTPVWNRKAVKGIIIYQINRDHPLILKLMKMVLPAQKEFLNNIITMFESCFPKDMYYHDIASMPEQVEKPEFTEDQLEMLLDMFIKTWSSSGIQESKLPELILSSDPFISSRDLTKIILKRKGLVDE